MAKVILEHVTKKFDQVIAVADFNLEIQDNEFIVFVGPSGCGKSTTLRMIAGLERQTAGNIYIGNQLVNDRPPRERNIAMVFQNYALYPHMNVYENMAFGLKLHHVPKKEIDRRVHEAAEILGISHLLKRKPKELSGGQRQRVALGRAIVREPDVFLMDEPLSNLDAKLRVQMRTEIAKLHRRMATTMIYVTHDQIEAMTMADRIVVMKDGVIQQIADPQNLYDQPVNRFVAGFIGTPPMNFLNCQLQKQLEGWRLVSNNIDVPVPDAWLAKIQQYEGREVTLGIRPENIHKGDPDRDRVVATAEVIEPLGSETYLYLKAGEQNLVARVSPDTRPAAGSEVILHLDMQKAHLFDKESGLTIV
ncbi:MAG: sn-glycerol-3-phosphate ABC transporter ATP-binding protein UgpC [Moorella humiferrea]|nr:sn-glycerol-3-phosphate ABC transporter ATP-binding protein UgpC [Moorella humiferrea]